MKPRFKLHLNGTVTLLSVPKTSEQSAAQEALNKLRQAGISVPAWARANGFSVETTKAVVFGHSKGIRGEAHRVAVALGIKAGARTAVEPHDWHPADVVAALRKKGTSLRQLAIANGYLQIQNVLVRPWWAVEQLVGQALGLPPEQIWPSRYASGVSREHAQRLTKNASALRAINAPSRSAPRITGRRPA